ncbi:MAG: thiamine pyrophosphate-dependent dehydrogenase E1 component subunit alpha [Clostridia bacterium]|nr:thiamine pyrophosphate-dependent dehydrogenase E1 component subunit alpha [Clostridia bacterium]
MRHIRYFEEKVMELLQEGYIKGGSHLYAGEEACAVGAMAAIRPDDYITSTHRGHGHAVAKDGDLNELMAEICGKATGCCKGKGGSLHLADLSTGNLGANGIVGGSFGIACGAALSSKMQKQDKVVLCFFGDGAANTGIAHEAMNMAAAWKLPVVFVCENNLYGMSVSVERATSVKDLSVRAKAYDMPAIIADGMDVLAVKEAVEKAAKTARKGDGPTFVELKTYRYFGHSRSDPRAYRTKEEEAEWKSRDAIETFEKRLIENGVITEEEAKKIDQEALDDINKSEEFAKASPDPKPEALYEDLFA